METRPIEFLIQHGYSVLFLWVLGEQMGLPIPSIPLLLAAGALAGQDKLSFTVAMLLVVVAAVIADNVWFTFGRKRGGAVLQLLCRVSLEPDSCVRRTENIFQRQGPRALLVSKFIPGLNAAAAPIAGVTGMKRWRFIVYDVVGSLIWSASLIGLGWIFSNQLEDLADIAARLGGWLVVLLIAALVGFIIWKYVQRRRFMKSLIVARVTPDEVFQRMQAGEAIAIVDLRHPLDILPDPRALPGAIRMTVDELPQRSDEIPRDRDVVLYCT